MRAASLGACAAAATLAVAWRLLARAAPADPYTPFIVHEKQAPSAETAGPNIDGDDEHEHVTLDTGLSMVVATSTPPTPGAGPPATAAETVAERLFRVHRAHQQRTTLRLCMHSLRQHAVRRIEERRFQGQLALQQGGLEEAQAERDAESEAQWHAMLERLVMMHEEVRSAQLEAAANAHEQQLEFITAAHEAQLHQLEAEVHGLEEALLASEVRHVHALREQRRAMLVGLGKLLANRRILLGGAGGEGGR